MKRWQKLNQAWLVQLQDLNKDLENISNHKKNIFPKQTQQRYFLLKRRTDFIKKLEKLNNDLNNAIQHFQTEQDQNMHELWNEEINNINNKIEMQNLELINNIIPNNCESIIMEIRAGQGGQEASLFANELANMYIKLCKRKNWQLQTFSTSYNENNGLKEGVFEITGNAVATWLASESGVHCVKRVPQTEKRGRTHTSTVTVAILPEPEDIEVIINDKDLKIDVFRSSGPGGQSVNTTDSAVRITHIPSGITVSQQDEKSQHKNKEKAMKILKARIYQQQLDNAQNELAKKRRESIGMAQRNERIRTYHFTQNWVNDDRLKAMCYNIDAFMEAEELEKFLEHLVWEFID